MNDTLDTIAAEVARSLSSFELVDGSAFVSTPLAYPGGASATAKITQHGTSFIVTDAGFGRQEAFLMGGERIFLRVATEIAARAGLVFDQDAFVIAETDRGGLVAAASAIVNASRTAVELTAFRLAEKVASEARAVMKVKLGQAFTPGSVTMNYSFDGPSGSWNFDAAVKSGGSLALFEIVTPSPQSTYSAVSRFVDAIEVGSPALRLVAVLQDRSATKHLRLIERSASLVDLKAEPEVWRKAAA